MINLIEEAMDHSRELIPGQLQVKGQQERQLPLAALHVTGTVLDSVADLCLRQRFRNSYDTPLEAVYIFPLPGAAAVYEFELQVGERHVSGQVQERQAARQAYSEALEQGHRAALMEQERDDVYTLQVGNIPPGEEVELQLRYVQHLDYREEGLFECRVPTVIAPRYIPGQAIDEQAGLGVESDTDLVPDASRITPPRLAPGFDPQVDLSIVLELDASQGLSELACTQHANRLELQAGRIRVELARQERLNRDFVLRWRNGSREGLSTRLIYLPGPSTAGEPAQGFGMLQLQAPAPAFLQGQHRNLIFLLDRSGSMGEHKMASAAQACDRLLNSLGPNDRFALQAFDDRIEWLEDDGVWFQADEKGKAQGRRFLRQIESRGGTELYAALQAALQEFPSETETLPVLVLLTDGEVGDESRLLKAVQTQLGSALVHTIGIDTALNDSFLQRLSRLGGGTHVSVTPREDLERVLENIASEIGYPALQNLKIDLPQLSPEPVPNLYLGRSLTLFFHGPCPEQLSLQAERNGEPTTLNFQPEITDFAALPRLWANSRIQSLEDRYRLAHGSEQDRLGEEMVAISCAQQVLSRLTAWLAVDESESIENAEQRRTVVQPVERPESWKNQSSRMNSLRTQFMMMGGAPNFAAAAMPAPFAQAVQPSPEDTAWKAGPNLTPAWEGSDPINQLIFDFLNALKAVLSALEAGSSPEWLTLKAAHEALSQALQNSNQAEALPVLQRLLRQESRQLLQALEAGHNKSLELLTERCRKQLDKIRNESAPPDEAPTERPAWKRSI